MDDEMLLIMLMDANSMGGIDASCKECGCEIWCEPDAMDAWCDNCDKVVKVNGLASLGLI